MTPQEMIDMELGKNCQISELVEVRRVPGGWIYTECQHKWGLIKPTAGYPHRRGWLAAPVASVFVPEPAEYIACDQEDQEEGRNEVAAAIEDLITYVNRLEEMLSNISSHLGDIARK